MDSPGEGQQRFWHLAKPSNQCSSATTAAKWDGMWVEDCQRRAPAGECGDDCTNPTQTEKSIGGCLGWWGSRGANWSQLEGCGANWSHFEWFGKEKRVIVHTCAHMCMHECTQVFKWEGANGCRWVVEFSGTQRNTKVEFWGSLKKIGLWWFSQSGKCKVQNSISKSCKKWCALA